MYSFRFTKYAEKSLKKMDQKNQKRIIDKLSFLKPQDDLSIYLKSLSNFYPATHRLRVGSMRVILQQVSDEEFLVLDVGKRGEVYK